MEKQKEYLAALAMPPLTARYSDGSTEEIPVMWDEKALSAVRLGSVGTYEVPGQAVVKEYDAPLVRGVADPVIRRIGEMYYLIGTNEFTEGKDLWIRFPGSKWAIRCWGASMSRASAVRVTIPSRRTNTGVM